MGGNIQKEQRKRDPTMPAKTTTSGKSITQFTDRITADGSSGYKAEANRYHVYASLACPWAHRFLIVLKLKGLEHVISQSIADWVMTEKGWSFKGETFIFQCPKCAPDPINGKSYLKEIYDLATPDYTGEVSVPCLWDKQKKTIVNNQLDEIIRMLNSEFNEFCQTDEQKELDLYPEELRKDIDAINEWVSPMINHGVYSAGLANSQEEYDEAVRKVFEALDKAEEILSKSRYLTGNRMTEADIRLFTTLYRFDTVYVSHFKCNKKRIVEYPNLWGFVRDMYQHPGVAATCDQDHIQRLYQASQLEINPKGIVAIGPDIDFNIPHERESVGGFLGRF